MRMTGDEDVDYRKRAVGPFAPPLPKTAENEEAEPMAVASDKELKHESFRPTSAPLDAFNEDVARRYHPEVKASNMEPRSDEETKRAQDPEGYTETDKRGFQHPDADEIDKEY